MHFLKQAASLLTSWKASGKPGLTSETFSACILSLTALADISCHLIERHKFKYVLLGKLQSDPLEGRFGLYRQVNGASYIVTIRQILQAEKKLRILSLLQQKVIEEAAEDTKLETLTHKEEEKSKSDDVCWLVDSFEITEEQNTEADESVVYYCAGYLSRSIARAQKCDQCKDLLINNSPENNDKVALDIDPNTKLFDIVSRGGLTRPSPISFSICLIIYNFFSQINANQQLRSEFFKKERHMQLFVEAVTVKTATFLPVFTNLKCSNQHLCFEIFARKLFNLFSRNVLKRFNDSCKKMTDDGRKIRKLQSESSK